MNDVTFALRQLRNFQGFTLPTWRKRLGSDPDVIGRSIALNDVAHTIVDVLPNLPISWFGRDSEVFIATPFDNPNATKERVVHSFSFHAFR